MARCLIVGETNNARHTRKHLETSGVPTIAIAHHARVDIMTACMREKKLEVVAVFCNDFPADYGSGLLVALRERLGSGVMLHVLMKVEEDEDEELLRATISEEARVDEFYFAPSFKPVDVAASIHRRWFCGKVRTVRLLDRETTQTCFA